MMSDKTNLVKSIKRKRMLDPSASDQSGQQLGTKAKKLKGNKNASKEVRKIEFGWFHNGNNIKKNGGGGTRDATMAKSSKPHELLNVAKRWKLRKKKILRVTA